MDLCPFYFLDYMLSLEWPVICIEFSRGQFPELRTLPFWAIYGVFPINHGICNAAGGVFAVQMLPHVSVLKGE